MQKKYVPPSILYAFLVLFFIVSITRAQGTLSHKTDSLNRIYENTRDHSQKKKALTALSNIYQDKGDWESYENIVQKMLLLQEEEPDSFYLAETYNKLGISNCLLGQQNAALDYFNKALAINMAQNNRLTAANSYENLSTVYKYMGDYQKAAENLLTSLKIRQEQQHPRIFNNYMKLAVLQQLLEDTPKEDYYLKLAKKEMQKQDSITPRNKAIFYNELGNIYNTRELYDSCIVCYINVIHYATKIGWKLGIAEGIGNLADVYSKTGSLDSAIFYHQKSLSLSMEIKDYVGMTEEYLYLAELYQQYGSSDSVLFYTNNALETARSCNLLREESLVFKFLADYYNKQNEHVKAYSFLEQYYLIKDSISSTRLKSNIAELETKYETSIKAQQIELLTAENKLKNEHIRQSFLLIGLLIVLLSLILFLLYYRKKQAKFKQLELQQQLLRSQMNPHFIFNVMGSIQSFMYKNDSKTAAEYLSRFASLSRSVLNNSTQEHISLKEEIDMLKNYIELEKARMEPEFESEFITSEDLEQEFIHIPPMLIQPFVENSIKHGFKNIKYIGRLSIRFKEENNTIAVEIVDNGSGLSPHHDPKLQSKALHIFNQRKKGIEQKFNKKITFELTDIKTHNGAGKGVSVVIHLPIINYD